MDPPPGAAPGYLCIDEPRPHVSGDRASSGGSPCWELWDEACHELLEQSSLQWCSKKMSSPCHCPCFGREPGASFRFLQRHLVLFADRSPCQPPGLTAGALSFPAQSESGRNLIRPWRPEPRLRFPGQHSPGPTWFHLLSSGLGPQI